MPLPPVTATVQTHFEDKGRTYKDSDRQATEGLYWAKAAAACNAGDELTITLTGSSQTGVPRFNNGVSWFDPDGNRINGGRDAAGWTVQARPQPSTKEFLCPKLPQHALVAKFGQGEPFLVGKSGWSGVAPANDLYVAVNDKFGQFFTNEGTYTVQVQQKVSFPLPYGTTFAVDRNYAAESGHYLVFQSDGNIVVYKPGRNVPQNAVWALLMVSDKWKTAKRAGFDYQLYAEDGSGQRIWSSPAQDGNNTRLVLDNGVLRIVRPATGPGAAEQTLWSSAQR
ncbi:hypothetical protein [Pseudonocardia oroxyli]|uniref:Bulb-type lectin domain-containing protein n=1 Tax=Pseudonocardia oroxyli TaxID=366584 RepID=A0A1G7SYC8_PSEOR|nr:hypothetical protein [Pseudonocardia oroxyli]SDG27862.1 hypothetical protein SAMN05216377_110134 [Pseudonocardia oroxyli]